MSLKLTLLAFFLIQSITFARVIPLEDTRLAELEDINIEVTNFGVLGKTSSTTSQLPIISSEEIDQILFSSIGVFLNISKPQPTIEYSFDPFSNTNKFLPGSLQDGTGLDSSKKDLYQVYFSKDYDKSSGRERFGGIGPGWPLWSSSSKAFDYQWEVDDESRNANGQRRPVFYGDFSFVLKLKASDLSYFSGDTSLIIEAGYPSGAEILLHFIYFDNISGFFINLQVINSTGRCLEGIRLGLVVNPLNGDYNDGLSNKTDSFTTIDTTDLPNGQATIIATSTSSKSTTSVLISSIIASSKGSIDCESGPFEYDFLGVDDKFISNNFDKVFYEDSSLTEILSSPTPSKTSSKPYLLYSQLNNLASNERLNTTFFFGYGIAQSKSEVTNLQSEYIKSLSQSISDYEAMFGKVINSVNQDINRAIHTFSLDSIIGKNITIFDTIGRIVFRGKLKFETLKILPKNIHLFVRLDGKVNKLILN